MQKTVRVSFTVTGGIKALGDKKMGIGIGTASENRNLKGGKEQEPAPAVKNFGIENIAPGIKGAGIDLIRIRRIARAYRRRPERFLQRIFTEKEIAFLKAKKNPFPSMAALFAAKEAISKALGCGIGKIGWREMEILPGERGQPVAILKGGALVLAKELDIQGVVVSLSHDAPYALAQAIAYGRSCPGDHPACP